MTDTQQTLLRSVLKLGAGALVAHGLTDESGAQMIVGGIIAIIGVVWGLCHRNNTTP